MIACTVKKMASWLRTSYTISAASVIIIGYFELFCAWLKVTKTHFCALLFCSVSQLAIFGMCSKGPWLRGGGGGGGGHLMLSSHKP